MSERVKLLCTKAFYLQGIGTVRQGQEFDATATQAQFLQQRGRAMPVPETVEPPEAPELPEVPQAPEVPGPTENQADAGPQEAQSTGPESTQESEGAEETADELPAEVKNLGGGWFELDGEKYQGRAAVDEALAGK